MTKEQVWSFIQDELKRQQARDFRDRAAEFLRMQSIYGMPRPVVLDAQGNEVSRVYDHKWSSEYMGTFDNAPLMPTLTLGELKSAEKAVTNAVVGVAEAEVQPGDKLTFTVMPGTFLPWFAPPPYSFPVEVTITPEPYRPLDADARTRTAEWQDSVRQRFERRVGAALTSTPQQT